MLKPKKKTEAVVAEPEVAPGSVMKPISDETQKALDDFENLPMEEKAAKLFTSLLPQFKVLSKDMTKSELKRVLNALVEAPLNEEKFKFYRQIEVNAFNTGMAIMNAKHTMMFVALNQKAEEEKAKTEEKKEESNAVV